tara:strand:- start:380 stop:493 length:114 start_codon:yes stop_codon:yes gene_type:complete
MSALYFDVTAFVPDEAQAVGILDHKGVGKPDDKVQYV